MSFDQYMLTGLIRCVVQYTLCYWFEAVSDVNYVMMYTFRQAMHYLMSVATLTITIRVYLWCSGQSYWAGRGWALIGVKVLHVECFSSLSTWVEWTLHTVALAWLKWFRQMDGWMLTPWNHLYKWTFHWAWHFSMDPVHVASHFLNSHSTKGR